MNKIMLITGARSGFGKAHAELFGAKGWRLIICGLRKNRLLQIRNDFPQGQVHCLPLDVRDRRQVQNFLPALPTEFRDTAGIVFPATSVPPYVNINTVEVVPACQSWSPFAIHRNTDISCE